MTVSVVVDCNEHTVTVNPSKYGTGRYVEAYFARQLERELAELRAENERLENLTATGIHTCSDQCQRPLCVLRRENAELRQKLAEAQKDGERLDWLSANMGRVEAMEPHPPSLLWKWFVFLKRKDPDLSLNSLRAAIDAARGQTP